jgi:hypothetical protein
MFKINSPNDISIRVDSLVVENLIKVGESKITRTDIENWNHMSTGNGEYPENIDVKTIIVNDTTTPDSDTIINESSVTIHKPGSESKLEADKLTIDGKTVSASKIQSWDDGLSMIVPPVPIPDNIECESLTCKTDTLKNLKVNENELVIDDSVKNSKLTARKLEFNTVSVDPETGDPVLSGKYIDENKIVKIDNKLNEPISVDSTNHTITIGRTVPVANDRTEIGFKGNTNATYVHGIYENNHSNGSIKTVYVDESGKLISQVYVPPPPVYDGTYTEDPDENGNGGGLFGTLLNIGAAGVSLVAAGGASLASMGSNGFTIGNRAIDAAQLAKWDEAYNRVPGTKFIDGQSDQVALRNVSGTKQLTTDLSHLPEGNLFSPRPVENWNMDIVSVSSTGAQTAFNGGRLFSNNRLFSIGRPSGYQRLESIDESTGESVFTDMDEFNSSNIVSLGADNLLTDNSITIGSGNTVKKNSIIIGNDVLTSDENSITIGDSSMTTTRIYGITDNDLTNETFQSVGIDSTGRLGVFTGSSGSGDVSYPLDPTFNSITMGSKVLTETTLTGYDQLASNQQGMMFGTGVKTNIATPNFISMFNSSKTVSANSWDHGIVIDNGSIANTQIVRNSVLVGTNNSSGTATGSFNNCIFGQVNSITKTKEACIFGKDNMITSDVSDANYSVICGTNNTITDTRAFIFGRDNDLQGPRNNSYTNPSIVIGNNNDTVITKGKSILIGTDIGTNLINEDGLSNCIIIGNGKHDILPYTMHLGADEITDTFIHGISGTGDYLKIDENNKITRTTIANNVSETEFKYFDPDKYEYTVNASSLFNNSFGQIKNKNFAIWISEDYFVGNFDFMLRFCVKKSDIPAGYQPKYIAKIKGSEYNKYTATVNFIDQAIGSVVGETENETFYRYNILVSHTFDDSSKNFKDAIFELTRYYEPEIDNNDSTITPAPRVVFS